jgi:hypothetical protein
LGNPISKFDLYFKLHQYVMTVIDIKTSAESNVAKNKSLNPIFLNTVFLVYGFSKS